MSQFSPTMPVAAHAAKKRLTAERREADAARLRAEADELEAAADRRARIADKVRADRIAQGLPAELTQEQVDAIGTVWASRPQTTPSK